MALVLRSTLQAPEPPAVIPEPPRPASPFGETEVVTVRQTGGRPLEFKGSELLTATSHSPGPSLWYEIYVWRTVAGGFVVQIRMFAKSERMKDRFRVFQVDSVEELAHLFETYDTSKDIDADIPVDDKNVHVAEIALQAAALRMKVDEGARQFADLVGEILHSLEVQG